MNTIKLFNNKKKSVEIPLKRLRVVLIDFSVLS